VKAATIHAYGGPEVFRIENISPPRAGPRDLLVSVRAAGVNPVDCKIRSGTLRAIVRHRLPVVLGLDVSGVVVAVGRSVTRFRVGDEVFASPTHRRPGTYAELVAIDEAEAAHKPTRLSHVEAASLPLVGQTAWRCLVDTAHLRAGERVFIQAGAGGVGTFAIQLAKHLGAEVATTSSPQNVDLVKRLGADHIIDHTRERFDDLLRDYDVVLESIGGSNLARGRRVLCRGGRLVYITSGLDEEVRRYGLFMGAAATLGRMLWFRLSSRLRRKRARFVVRRPDGRQLAQIADLVDRHAIEPVVERTFPLEQIAEAHRAIETGRTRGKIVIDLAM
jgi:NADPH:quinone reductase-like Zn-dependent oxidoreductase